MSFEKTKCKKSGLLKSINKVITLINNKEYNRAIGYLEGVSWVLERTDVDNER